MAKQNDWGSTSNTKGPAFEKSDVNDVTGLAKRITPSIEDQCRRVAAMNDKK